MPRLGRKHNAMWIVVPSHTASTTWLTISLQSRNDIYLKKGIHVEPTYTNDRLEQREYLRPCSSYEKPLMNDLYLVQFLQTEHYTSQGKN